MKRKVIKQGNNTLTITLPRKWTERVGVRGGDEMNVEERGSSLLLGLERTTSQDVTQLDTAKLGLLHKNYISYLYQSGYDEVRVTFHDKKTFVMIQNMVADCIGFEIVDHGENYCLIKNVAVGVPEEFDRMLRRMFDMILSMAEGSLEALKKGQFSRLPEIALLEKSTDRISEFLLRILVKKGYADYRKTPFAYSLVRDLEKMADVYRYMCDCLYGNGKGLALSKETLQLYGEVNGYFRNFYELFYSGDRKRAQALDQGRDRLLERAYALCRSRPQEEGIFIAYLINVVALTFDLGGPYFRMTL